ncbi:MAG: LysE family transporter [Enterobacter hormaechei]
MKAVILRPVVFIGDAVLMFLAWAGWRRVRPPRYYSTSCYLGAFYLLYLGSKIYATLKGKNGEAKSDEPQYGAILNAR